MHGQPPDHRIAYLTTAYPQDIAIINELRQKAGRPLLSAKSEPKCGAHNKLDEQLDEENDPDGPAIDYRALAEQAINSYNFPGGNMGNLQETEDYKSLGNLAADANADL